MCQTLRCKEIKQAENKKFRNRELVMHQYSPNVWRNIHFYNREFVILDKKTHKEGV